MDSPRFDDPVLDSMILWFVSEDEEILKEEKVNINGVVGTTRVIHKCRYAAGVFTRHGEEIIFHHKLPGEEIVFLGVQVPIEDLISAPAR